MQIRRCPVCDSDGRRTWRVLDYFMRFNEFDGVLEVWGYAEGAPTLRDLCTSSQPISWNIGGK